MTRDTIEKSHDPDLSQEQLTAAKLFEDSHDRFLCAQVPPTNDEQKTKSDKPGPLPPGDENSSRKDEKLEVPNPYCNPLPSTSLFERKLTFHDLSLRNQFDRQREENQFKSKVETYAKMAEERKFDDLARDIASPTVSVEKDKGQMENRPLQFIFDDAQRKVELINEQLKAQNRPERLVLEPTEALMAKVPWDLSPGHVRLKAYSRGECIYSENLAKSLTPQERKVDEKEATKFARELIDKVEALKDREAEAAKKYPGSYKFGSSDDSKVSPLDSFATFADQLRATRGERFIDAMRADQNAQAEKFDEARALEKIKAVNEALAKEKRPERLELRTRTEVNAGYGKDGSPLIVGKEYELVLTEKHRTYLVGQLYSEKSFAEVPLSLKRSR